MTAERTLYDDDDLSNSYRKAMGNHTRLSPDEVQSLASHIQTKSKEAKAAEDRLVASNLPLVVSTAKKFMHMGLKLPDLVQEGNIGLVKAVRRFDPSRGIQFSTYATFWIKREIRRALGDKGRPIRIPIYLFNRWHQMRIKERKLKNMGAEPLTVEAKAEIMEVSLMVLKSLEGTMSGWVSFEEPLTDGDKRTFADTVSDPDADTEAPLVTNQTAEKIRALVEQVLTDEQKIIVQGHYGFDGEEPRQIKKVAETLKVTPDRGRKIHGAALKRLRAAYL